MYQDSKSTTVVNMAAAEKSSTDELTTRNLCAAFSVGLSHHRQHADGQENSGNRVRDGSDGCRYTPPDRLRRMKRARATAFDEAESVYDCPVIRCSRRAKRIA